MAPADLAQLPASHAALLGAVVSAPAPALAKRVEFLRRLRIRRKLLADDFLRFAPTIGEDAAVASRFEDLLNKHQHLLTPKTIASLRSVPFLHSRTGSLLEPERLHLPTTANLACLGSDDPLVAGDNNSLYRRLRCRELPSSETLLGVVRRLKQSGVPPTRPEIFYPALVSALRAEKLPTTAHVDEPLLWVSGAYHTPRDTLVGSRIPRLFRVALPIFRGPDVTERAYDDLGASVHPRDHHWIIFFQSFAEKVRSAAEQNILRAAYQRRGQLGLPDGLTETTRCLLSRDGSLHSLQDLHSASFLEDDYPQLATALSEQGADIVFADMVEGNRPFFLALGLKRLSDACGIPRVEMGAAGAPPSWFRSTHESDILSRFRLEDFATALHEVAWTHQRQTPEFRAARTVDLRGRLAAISQIKFVANLERVYRIAGNHCRVAAEAAVISDRIALSPARNMFDLEQMIAYALAELSGATRLADARALAVAILPLLRCRTRTEMRAYLTRQGASPPEWSGVELDFTETDAEDQPDARAEDIVRQIVGTLNTNPLHSGRVPTSNGPKPLATGTRDSNSAAAPFVLPPVEAVQVTVAEVANTVIAPLASAAGSGGRSGGAWSPPNPIDVERDRIVGERGEELVYRLEIDRLRAAGHRDPQKDVIWTSRSDPGADHDIRSIATDGQPLWIEVKSTTGTDGRFEWPRAEFEKALREGNHYELWRVYEAHTERPTAKAFRDPASLLRTSALRLELSALRAFVEAKDCRTIDITKLNPPQ